MSQRLYPPDRPQTIGEVLDTSFRIFRVSLVKCLPFGIATTLIGQLPNLSALLTERTQGPGPVLLRWDWWALYVVSILLTTLIGSALMLREAAIVTGRPTQARAELLAALRRLPAVIAGSLLYLLVGFIAGAGAGIVVGFGITRANMAVIGLGLLLFAPAVYVTEMLWAFFPAILLKGKGPISGLSYSFYLMRGNFWRVMVILTVAILVVLAAYLIIGVLAASLVSLGSADIAVAWAFTTVIVVVCGSLLAPLITAFLLATFGDLQVRREGIDLERRIAGAAAGT